MCNIDSLIMKNNWITSKYVSTTFMKFAAVFFAQLKTAWTFYFSSGEEPVIDKNFHIYWKAGQFSILCSSASVATNRSFNFSLVSIKTFCIVTKKFNFYFSYSPSRSLALFFFKQCNPFQSDCLRWQNLPKRKSLKLEIWYQTKNIW